MQQKPLKTDYAYFAGLVDGEGCIGVYSRVQGGFQLRIQVCMAEYPIMHWAQRTFGGSLNRKAKQLQWKTRPHRQMWVWVVSDATAERVLRALLPHFKGKKAEALVALRFRKHVTKLGGRTTAVDLKAQERLAQKLKQLKRREYV